MTKLAKKTSAIKKTSKRGGISASVGKSNKLRNLKTTIRGKVAEKRATEFRKMRNAILKTKKNTCYQDYLIESLKDPEEAAGYLNAALIGGDIKVFLMALQNVVQAQGGIAVLSEKMNKSRTSLYKSLSEKGNPYLKNANELLNTLGMHLVVVPGKKQIP